MTLAEMIEEMRSRVREALATRSEQQTTLEEARSTINEITAGVEARDDQTLTAEETTRLNEARTAADAARAAVAAADETRQEAEARVSELEDEQRRDAAAAAAAARFGGEPVVTGGDEPLTYSPEARTSYFSDMFNAQQGDHAAAQRLARHDEEMRAITTGEFGGAHVVPQYLADEFAPNLHAGRPFVDAVRSAPIPAEGMVFTIDRGQTSPTVASQATQNTEVSNTNADYNDPITVNVVTIAGQQDVARQALERGTGVDSIIYADLVGAYAAELDNQAINGAGTSGTHKGIANAVGGTTVTYTDLTPSFPALWPKLADLQQQVAKARMLGNAMLWVMAARRWGWIQSQLDTTNRPFAVGKGEGPFNSPVIRRAAENGHIVGDILNTPVLVDFNVAENSGAGTEDIIYLVRAEDIIVWEDGDGMPRELRFEESDGGALQTNLVVYGYTGFTAERYPSAIGKITGTGLIAPSF